MIYKNIKLIFKYSLLFVLLIVSPLIFDLLYDYMMLNTSNYNPYFTISFIIPYLAIILPYVEIKISQYIIEKYSNTLLIKLFSTWLIPIVIMILLCISDIMIDFYGRCANFSALIIFSIFISFSASFIPFVMVSFWYKIAKKNKITNFFNSKWNFIFLLSTILVFLCIK